MKESSTKLKSQPTGGLHFILIINNFWTTGIMLDVESFNLETFFLTVMLLISFILCSTKINMCQYFSLFNVDLNYSINLIII